MSKGVPSLTPAQQKTAGDLLASLSAGHLCLLRASAGMGKTSVLRWIQAQNGGAFVNASQFMTLLKRRDPAAIEETFMETLQTAVDESDLILVDDLHLIMAVVESFDYQRSNLINAALSAVLADAEARNKKFVFAVDKNNEPSTLRERASVWKIEDFESEDFAHLCSAHLGSPARALDFEKIHRFAPH